MAWCKLWSIDRERVEALLLSGVLAEDVVMCTHSQLDQVLDRLDELGLWTFLTQMPVKHGKGNAFPSPQMLGSLAMLELMDGDTHLASAGKVLQNAALIERLGFNLELRDRRRQGEGFVSPNTLRNHLKRVPRGAGPKALLAQAQYMRQRKWLRGKEYAADGTWLEVGKDTTHEGAGKVWDKDEQRWAYGYKLMSLQNLTEGRPRIVAMDLAAINTDERQMLLQCLDSLVGQMGLQNLRQMIHLLTLDRGFWGAQFLYRLGHDYKLKFLIPGKRDLDLLQEAKAQQQLRKTEYRAYQVEDQTTGRLHTIELCGLENVALNGYSADGTGSGDVNVVLAREWMETRVVRGKREEAHWEEWYYVTNQPLGKDWLAIYLQYQRRWGIENQGFRQLKQRYHLEQLPGRSLNAIEARTALVLMLYNAMSIVQMKYPDDGLRALALQRKLGEPTPLAKVTLAVYIGQTMALFPGTEYQRLALIGERRRTLADVQAAVDGLELPAKLRAKLAKILQT
ncbi:MAG: transposase [Candidatus Wallbacteria bacterium]|nr:transposase [Candidatus Wallbacteria bacterium]